MEKNKEIYLLWHGDDIITYFEEDEFHDLIELIIDLNFEDEYYYFLEMLSMGDSIEEALCYCRYGSQWSWEPVKYRR